MMKSKPLQIALLVLVIAGIWFWADATWNIGDKLSLEFLKESQADLVEAYEKNPATILAVYMGLYVVMAALSFPGAAIMTIAAGMIFGVVVGTLAVSFASTLGATLAFLVARTLLGDWVQERWGDSLETINRGVEREGAFYLFSLRVVPAVPFFLVNLLMALTSIRTITFAWVSQVGMLAGTATYVFAGTQLGSISSVQDILSWKLLLAFALLGLFPIAAKKGLEHIRDRKGLSPEVEEDGV